ncbi:hypothetical protein NPX13_g1363 [Xylaria arbuscula]|uniref:Rhodopsin domain-containing protein n=1 Tax=Xylaria arbuscula TaxID=114810 RepID=A0A9W8TQ87_9PEZI|nr:hypothetical protein NPX13_g1363 [Xylaria arbuscula]
MDDNNSTIIAGAIVGVLALVAVILRFYVRYSRRSGFSWDDWFILVSMLSVIVIDAVDLYATAINPNGAEVASSNGRIEYTPLDVLFTKITFTSTVLYFTLTSTTKLSILFLYNRLFSINRPFRQHVIVLIGIVIGFWISTTVADLLNCIPLKWTWLNSLDDPRYCFNYNYFWLATGIVEAVIDVAILSLPIPVVSRLKLKGTKKYGIIGVFLVGFFVVISGVVKVVLSYVPDSREPSFNQTQVWTTVHSCTGIICACMPVCWPLIASLGKMSSRKWAARMSPGNHWHLFADSDSRKKAEQDLINEANGGFDRSTSDTRQILPVSDV